jgi:hypothetical protein
VRAGTLDWSCATTADHAVDTVLAPAFFLASRKQDDYPAGEPFTLGPDAGPEQFAEGVETAARVLRAVVTTTPPEVEAIIWRAGQPHTAPREDFVPRAGMELILHAHDVCSGLGVPFTPPADVVDRLRVHTRAWPYWTMAPGWSDLRMADDPWPDLLRASGRA